ncbi:kinesin, putative [Bodo saltans]|uniref:Kinesin, putative n=1 Tax=Bodo saltans TaxID=75058 RepID=A0A0S4J3A4_BODSA|nr:kinesin, putative [Bodo saltans]|eukprot:CUG30409.1 kinesin, putative [Bodo saltans]
MSGRGLKHERVKVFARIGGDDGCVSPTSNGCEVNIPGRGRFPFVLDGCFGGGRVGTQCSVYEAIGQPALAHALNGFNSSVLAYGATGSGKTFSVFGNDNEPGIVPRLCCELFARTTYDTSVKLSIVEIYLEDVFDLLDERRELKVRRSENGTFEVAHAKQVRVSSYQEVLAQLQFSDRAKTVAATAIHERSSRAHTLCELTLTQPRGCGFLTSKIVIADLAGSERIKAAGTCSGTSLNEACNINLSLLTLGRCVEAVASGKTSLGEFRNSTLTKLLKDFIGGNSVTSMLVTLAPSLEESNNTIQTLRFADRAKQLQGRARENIMSANEKGENHVRRRELLELEFDCERRLEAAQKDVLAAEHCEMYSLLDSAISAREKIEEELESIRKKSYPREYALRNSLEQSREVAESFRDQVEMLKAMDVVEQCKRDETRDVLTRNCELEDEVERLKRRSAFFEEEVHRMQATMDQKIERLESEKAQLFLHSQLAAAAYDERHAGNTINEDFLLYSQRAGICAFQAAEVFCHHISKMVEALASDSSNLASSSIDWQLKSVAQQQHNHDLEMEEINVTCGKLQSIVSLLKVKSSRNIGLSMRSDVNINDPKKASL